MSILFKDLPEASKGFFEGMRLIVDNGPSIQNGLDDLIRENTRLKAALKKFRSLKLTPKQWYLFETDGNTTVNMRSTIWYNLMRGKPALNGIQIKGRMSHHFNVVIDILSACIYEAADQKLNISVLYKYARLTTLVSPSTNLSYITWKEKVYRDKDVSIDICFCLARWPGSIRDPSCSFPKVKGFRPTAEVLENLTNALIAISEHHKNLE